MQLLNRCALLNSVWRIPKETGIDAQRRTMAPTAKVARDLSVHISHRPLPFLSLRCVEPYGHSDYEAPVHENRYRLGIDIRFSTVAVIGLELLTRNDSDLSNRQFKLNNFFIYRTIYGCNFIIFLAYVSCVYFMLFNFFIFYFAV